MLKTHNLLKYIYTLSFSICIICTKEGPFRQKYYAPCKAYPWMWLILMDKRRDNYWLVVDRLDIAFIKVVSATKQSSEVACMTEYIWDIIKSLILKTRYIYLYKIWNEKGYSLTLLVHFTSDRSSRYTVGIVWVTRTVLPLHAMYNCGPIMDNFTTYT